MKRLLIILVTVIAISLIFTQPAFAQFSSHHAGNQQSSAYGLSADIYTPSSAPWCDPNNEGESSWVGTGTISDSFQTGWLYYPVRGYAEPYVEVILSGQLIEQPTWGSQSWNTYKNYKVRYQSGYWDAYINGTLYATVSYSSLPTPPTTVAANAEIHDSTSTVINTVFNNVQWMNSSQQWNYMNQWGVINYPPYYNVTFYSNYYYFLCYGP